MVDYHMHLQSEYYDNIEDVINNCLANNVKYIVTSGYDLNSSLEAIRLANTYSFVYASIGISPQCIEDFNEENLKIIEENLSNPKVLFVGEIGLDYYYGKDNKDIQQELFKCQLDLAKKYHLPVMIHSRDAVTDTYNLLKESNVKGIMHCYSYSLMDAKRFVELGFKLSIGGVVTFKNGRVLKEVVKEIDLDNLVTETDSPFLAPEPVRGTINDPTKLKYIIEAISLIKGIPINEIIESTLTNFDQYRQKKIANF